MEQPCPFCSPEPRRVVGANSLAIAIRDAFPVSPGHTLIVPRRHIASASEATSEEFAAIWSLLMEARVGIERELGPGGFNVGINDGPAAGQTVMHMHVHLIPRFVGDCLDPRGGVRWVLPEKARYWD
jgi:diadenosine tetraphosphate (Ap4A) HIT family hydrolase